MAPSKAQKLWKSSITVSSVLGFLSSSSSLVQSDGVDTRLPTPGAAVVAAGTVIPAPGHSGEDAHTQPQETSEAEEEVEDDRGDPGHVHQGACTVIHGLTHDTVPWPLTLSPVSLHPEMNVNQPAATEASTCTPNSSL